jgi:hypothetical protein
MFQMCWYAQSHGMLCCGRTDDIIVRPWSVVGALLAAIRLVPIMHGAALAGYTRSCQHQMWYATVGEPGRCKLELPALVVSGLSAALFAAAAHPAGRTALAGTIICLSLMLMHFGCKLAP